MRCHRRIKHIDHCRCAGKLWEHLREKLNAVFVERQPHKAVALLLERLKLHLPEQPPPRLSAERKLTT